MTLRNLIAAGLLVSQLLAAAPRYNVSGSVTCGDRPVEGVLVSDGKTFARTDAKGRYSMRSGKEQQTIFVVTPSGYMAESEDGLQPAFWKPLGPNPRKREKADFRLVRQDQGEYAVAFIADLHLCSVDSRQDLKSFRDDLVPLFGKLKEKYGGSRPVYTVNLGDLSFEKFWYEDSARDSGGLFTLENVLQILRGSGLPGPMYSVLGNHDHDVAVKVQDPAAQEFASAHLYRRLLGPSWYSVNIGGDHWIFINDIQYRCSPGKNLPKGHAGNRDYRDAFNDESLEWLRKDLEFVEPGTKVYLCSHCPMVESVRGGKIVSESQVTELEMIFAPHGGIVDIWTGHRHRFDFGQDPEWPHLRNRTFAATSGDCWQTFTKTGRSFSFDGTPQGVTVGIFKNGRYELHYETAKEGEKVFRAYDLNAEGVGKPVANGILINYWLYTPGDEIRVYEDGRELEVIHTRDFRDPYVWKCYYANNPSRGYAPSHMFLIKAGSPDSTVRIVIRDAGGRLMADEEFRRPSNLY